MRILRLLLGVMALPPTCAVAGEPTGFERLAFGTTRSVLVVEPSFRARCHPAPVTRTGARVQESRVTCPTYDLKDLGAIRVAFLFSAEDRLIGYVMYIARDHQDEARTKIETLYGPPTRQWEQGAHDRVAVAVRDRSIPDLPLPRHRRLPYRESKGARPERHAREAVGPTPAVDATEMLRYRCDSMRE